MHEERTPFAGSLAIIGRVAAEFVTAVEMTAEFGFAPTGDELAALTAEEFGDFARFHRGSPRMTRRTQIEVVRRGLRGKRRAARPGWEGRWVK